MMSLCAWCPDSVEAFIHARARGVEVSHGICADCAKQWNADAAAELVGDGKPCPDCGGESCLCE